VRKATQLFRCPNCQHWRCRECEDNSRLWLRCCQCGETARAVQWYWGQAKGRPHDLEHLPRLGTGRPLGSSKPIVESLMQFLEGYGIPLNTFGRHTTISPWAIRQARAGKRALSPRQEQLINRTLQRIQVGRLWLRRKSRQRWELEWVVPSWKISLDYIEPPPAYKPHCPMSALYCHGGVLPGSCPRLWNECVFNGKDWEAIEKIHQAYAQPKA
jgi:hypothetical protein